MYGSIGYFLTKRKSDLQMEEMVMPIVFVHGVNNRKSPSYHAQVAVTRSFLQQRLDGAELNGKTLRGLTEPNKLLFPYWGDLGTSFAWDMASLPRGPLQALGGVAEASLRAVAATLKDGSRSDLGQEPLITMAKQDFGLAVEVLASLMIEDTPAGKESEVARFVIVIQNYAVTETVPTWLNNLATDEQFIEQLQLAVDEQSSIQAQGLGDMFNAVARAAWKLKECVKGLVGKAVDATGDFASSKLLGWVREPLNENLGCFFGDVFHYFDGRGDKDNVGAIPARILQDIDAAAIDAEAGSEPLIIIGHSMGGVITFDLLSHYRPNLEVDLFVSVGSQVAHFEEIKLYHVSDKAIKPPAKAPKPNNIRHWINIFDTVDVFSYACKDVFDFNNMDVDAEYDTKTYVVKSHSEYFKQARFYDRLRVRIDGL
mgnify:CR=1 FL=1|tara:strand:+ start:50692 stop:51972 length:1281 start_codon:yes stop_codon:yes gene_type:complete